MCVWHKWSWFILTVIALYILAESCCEYLALNKRFFKFYSFFKKVRKKLNGASLCNSQIYSLEHFHQSFLIIIIKLITDTNQFNSYSCIILTNNFNLGSCSGNMLDVCSSEKLFQPPSRMKATAAPRASKRSMTT